MDKLYVIVRRDLPPGDQACQSIHAALQYAAEHPDWQAWFTSSNTLALLSVADEQELGYLLHKAKDRGLKTAAFHETDLGNSMTSIALEPGFRSGRLCSRFALALSEFETIPA